MGIPVTKVKKHRANLLDFMDHIQDYKKQITENWQKSLESVMKVANLLVGAKQELDKKEWYYLINELPFTKSTTSKLLCIGKDKRIVDPENLAILPFSYATLYEISLLSDDEFSEVKKQGILSDKVQRKDITEFKNKKRGIPNQKMESPENKKLATIYINPLIVNFDTVLAEIESKISGLNGFRIEFTNLRNNLEKAFFKKLSAESEHDFPIPARKTLKDFVAVKRKELNKKKSRRYKTGKKFAEIGLQEIDDMLKIGIKNLDDEALEYYLKFFGLEENFPQLISTCYR